MAEEQDAHASRSASPEAAAIGITMHEAAANPSVANEARAFLREQTEVLRLQKDVLTEERRLNLSHLRFRRFGDVAKSVLEIGVGLVALLIVCGFAAMVWDAAGSGGLVIEAFSVPPDLAARGLSGQVVASKLLDRLVAMQAETDSQRDPRTYANYWGDDIKVEIPSTGISLGELERLLREKLGHPTHISGEIVHNGTGMSATARAGTEGSGTVSGGAVNTDAQIQKLAETVYRITEPYRYGIWLREHDRNEEGLAIFAALARNGPARERPWGWLGVGNALEESQGIHARLRVMRDIARRWPDVYLAGQNVAFIEDTISHPEQAISELRAMAPLLSSADHGGVRSDMVPVAEKRLQSFVDANLGAFHEAASLWREQLDFGAQGTTYNMHAMLARSQLGEHDVAAARATMADPSETGGINSYNGAFDVVCARMLIGMEAGDWRSVITADRIAAAPLYARYPGLRSIAATTEVPLLAYANAKRGNIDTAEALIGRTPGDCYVCQRFRARIAELRGQHERAEWWFGRAVSQQPSIPFAWSEWGAALLARGNAGAAIEKFERAHQSGPRFADPLEMWGEALMEKNRSDLALAKFEEANTYAPNWGRLHLEWGKALFYAGRQDEGRKQLRMASKLDLSAADRARLAGAGAAQ